jgi:hypothetical protein
MPGEEVREKGAEEGERHQGQEYGPKDLRYCADQALPLRSSATGRRVQEAPPDEAYEIVLHEPFVHRWARDLGP